jgi:hypothetical protein
MFREWGRCAGERVCLGGSISGDTVSTECSRGVYGTYLVLFVVLIDALVAFAFFGAGVGACTAHQPLMATTQRRAHLLDRGAGEPLASHATLKQRKHARSLAARRAAGRRRRRVRVFRRVVRTLTLGTRSVLATDTHATRADLRSHSSHAAGNRVEIEREGEATARRVGCARQIDASRTC